MYILCVGVYSYDKLSSRASRSKSYLVLYNNLFVVFIFTATGTP